MTSTEADAVAEDILDLGHVVFRRASWRFYDLILEHRDRLHHHARITYDYGVMEIFFGAGVQYALHKSLAEFLESFSIDHDASIDRVDQLAADRPHNAARSEIYHVNFMPTLTDEGERGKRIQTSEESVIEVTIIRSSLMAGDGWDVPATIGAAEFRIRGYVKAHLTCSGYVFAEQSAVFPGMCADEHFDSVYFEKEG